eukprot:533420_1
MFEISISQANTCQKRLTGLVYKWIFITQFIIIIICNVYNFISEYAQSPQVSQSNKIWNIILKNICKSIIKTIPMCITSYVFENISIICMSQWIKITQMVQQVLINIFYYYNIIYVSILVLYFVDNTLKHQPNMYYNNSNDMLFASQSKYDTSYGQCTRIYIIYSCKLLKVFLQKILCELIKS